MVPASGSRSSGLTSRNSPSTVSSPVERENVAGQASTRVVSSAIAAASGTLRNSDGSKMRTRRPAALSSAARDWMSVSAAAGRTQRLYAKAAASFRFAPQESRAFAGFVLPVQRVHLPGKAPAPVVVRYDGRSIDSIRPPEHIADREDEIVRSRMEQGVKNRVPETGREPGVRWNAETRQLRQFQEFPALARLRVVPPLDE